MTARDHHGGYILVAVLGVMVPLTGFMAAGSVMVRSALRGAAVGDESIAMDGLAQGGAMADRERIGREAAPTAVVLDPIGFGQIGLQCMWTKDHRRTLMRHRHATIAVAAVLERERNGDRLTPIG